MESRGDGARQSRSRTQTVRAAAAGAPRAYATKHRAKQHCASGCGDAPPARPGGGGAGLERVRGPADGVATIPGAHTRAIRGVCALIAFICISAGRRRRARGVASGGHGAGAAQGAPVRSSLLPLTRRPSLAVSGCAGAGRRKRSSSWGEAARRSSAPSAPGAAHYGPLARGRLSRGRVLTGVVRNLAQVQAHPRPANRELRRARSRQLGRRSC